MRTYLRHVVYKEDHFGCGICNRSYQSESEAKECLGNCWQIVLSQSLVSIVQGVSRPRYRCKLCFRKYETFDAASACSVACKTAFKPDLIDLGAFDIPEKHKFLFAKKIKKSIPNDAEVKIVDEESDAREQAHEELVHQGINAKTADKNEPSAPEAAAKEAAPAEQSTKAL